MLVNATACGPVTSHWPGSLKVNSRGHLQDFRVDSSVQPKPRCVLKKIIDENP